MHHHYMHTRPSIQFERETEESQRPQMHLTPPAASAATRARYDNQ